MEDIEAPGSKCKKTEFCDQANRTSQEQKRSFPFPVLHGQHIQILEAGIGNARCELFRKKIAELGGTLCSSMHDGPNVLIVCENMTADRLCRLLKIEGPQQLESVTVVQSLWLSSCIKNKKLVPTENYKLCLTTLTCTGSSDSSELQQPTSSQSIIQNSSQCSHFLSQSPKEDLDVDSSFATSGGEVDTKDDALHFNDKAKVLQRRRLPVCLNFWLEPHSAFCTISFSSCKLMACLPSLCWLTEDCISFLF